MSKEALYELLPWDTAFFGFGVARIASGLRQEEQLAGILEELRRKQVSLVYWQVEPDERLLELADRQQGYLVDRKTTYVADLTAIDPSLIESDPHIEEFKEAAPTSELEDLAIQSGEFSRFKADKNFPREKFEALYREWIRKAVDGTLADSVLVWRDEDRRICGMITLGRKGERADIGLVAVHSASRGKAIGSLLIRAAQARFVERGFTIGQVVTQGDNTPACRLYEKCGYRVDKVEYYFHFWLS